MRPLPEDYAGPGCYEITYDVTYRRTTPAWLAGPDDEDGLTELIFDGEVVPDTDDDPTAVTLISATLMPQATQDELDTRAAENDMKENNYE